MTALRQAGSLLALCSLVACIGASEPDRAEVRARPVAVADASVARAEQPVRPEFVAAGEGDADAVVRRALQAAQAQERRLVVYVGATWCEPCQAFHEALERGELDQALAGVRLVEFDSDRDGPRLESAGYAGRYIPRFVVPQADGRASARRIEGGIKGPGAVAHIMERLGPMLAQAGEP
ncbi:MAG: thioredoxin family protein [Myxococcales bacterium]|nr:thioredoxin family protein [Myxococcales bacterium]